PLRQARQPTLLVLSGTRRFRARKVHVHGSPPDPREAFARDQDHGRPVPDHGPGDQDSDACVGQFIGRIRVRPGRPRTETLYVTRTDWTESGRISVVTVYPTPAKPCDDRTDRTETGRNQQIDVSPNLDGGRSG